MLANSGKIVSTKSNNKRNNYEKCCNQKKKLQFFNFQFELSRLNRFKESRRDVINLILVILLLQRVRRIFCWVTHTHRANCCKRSKWEWAMRRWQTRLQDWAIERNGGNKVEVTIYTWSNEWSGLLLYTHTHMDTWNKECINVYKCVYMCNAVPCSTVPYRTLCLLALEWMRVACVSVWGRSHIGAMNKIAGKLSSGTDCAWCLTWFVPPLRASTAAAFSGPPHQRNSPSLILYLSTPKVLFPAIPICFPNVNTY